MAFSFFKKKKKTSETEPVSEENRPEEESILPEASLQPDVKPDIETDVEPELQSNESKAIKEVVEEKPLSPEEPAMDLELTIDQTPSKEPEPDIEAAPVQESDTDQEPTQTEESILQAQAPVQEKPTIQESTGLLSKLKSGLSKTRTILNTDVTELFSSTKAINDDLFDELEERLVTSDLGIDITMDLMERIRKKSRGLSTGDQLRQVLKDELCKLFHAPPPLPYPGPSPMSS